MRFEMVQVAWFTPPFRIWSRFHFGLLPPFLRYVISWVSNAFLGTLNIASVETFQTGARNLALPTDCRRHGRLAACATVVGSFFGC